MRFSLNFSFISLFFLPFSLNQYSHYETKSFTVPLDHFSMTDERTFTMRYLINDTFWLPHCGPIFLYPGNEGNIEQFSENTAFLWEAAIKFKGLVVFAEHRYYGSSRPFPNMSEEGPPEDLAYLSTSQVLADFVDLVYELRTNYQKAGSQSKDDKSKRSNAVIAIGGSYGGMLAAWMRMKYPAVVEGALASSAGMFQFIGMKECDTYYKIVRDEYRTIGGQPCVDNIKRSWSVFRNTLKDDNGKELITNTWNLCTPIKTQGDIEDFLNKIFRTYIDIAQYNYPYPTNFVRPLPANPVKAICDHLLNPSLSDNDLLKALHDAVSQFNLDEKTKKCFQWQGGSDPSSNALDDYFYYFQTCTELVTSFCSGDSEMFEPFYWNYTAYSESCMNSLNVKPKEKYDEKMYGGKDLRYASNIIFSNGGYDPWSGAGVLGSKGLPPSVIVQFMPDAAHHLDLRADNAADPPSVKNARKLYIQTFREWITNYLKQHDTVDEEYLKYLSTI